MADKDTSFLDDAPEAGSQEKIEIPQNVRQPVREQTWSEWSEKAIKGLPEGPIADYVPIVGPLMTRAKGAAQGKSYEEMKKELRQYEQQYPESAQLKSILGPMSLVVLPESASAIAGTTLLSSIGRTGIAALENVGISVADSIARGESADEIIEKGKMAGAFGAGFKGGQELVGQAGKLGAQVYAGIKPETMEYYRANRAAVNAAEPEIVYDDASIALGRTRQQLTDEQAKIAQEIQNQKDLLAMQASNIREGAKFKAKQAEKLGKEKADVLTRDAAERLFADISSARRDISQASAKAFDILEQSGTNIPITYYKGYITKLLQSRKIGQKIPATPENIYLYQHRKMLDEIGQKEIPAREMKMLIQNLDNEVNKIYEAQRAGQYVSAPEKEIQELRRMYSERLKTEVPGYREAMEPVATKTRVISDLEKLGFTGSPDKIYNTFMGIEKLNKKDKAEAIARFEQLYKTDYRTALNEARILRETNYLEQAAPEIGRANVIEKSRANVAKKYAPQEARIKRSFESIRGLTDANIQQALLRYGNNPQKNINLGKRLEALGQMSGKGKEYYTDMAKAVAAKNAFETAYTQGSRMTNLGAFSLAGVAKMAGANMEAIPAFAMLGSTIGAVADKLGPQTVKKIVDVVDSPLGKAVGKIITKAAQRGPQALIASHNVLLRTNEAYKNYILGVGEPTEEDLKNAGAGDFEENFLDTAPELGTAPEEGYLPEIPPDTAQEDEDELKKLLEE